MLNVCNKVRESMILKKKAFNLIIKTLSFICYSNISSRCGLFLLTRTIIPLFTLFLI